MNLNLQKQILANHKNYQHLKENSYWHKFLNRDATLYKEFEEKMKELYKERPTDKLNEFINNLDLIENVIMSLK